MQKGLTGKRPVKILDAANHVGVVSLLIFNSSGVNLYLGNDENSATTFNGVPILPNVLIPGMLWEGELWVGADVDNTEFRYQISNPIGFNDSKQNRGLNVLVTPQGFLSPKPLAIILLLFSLLGIPKIGKADQHFSATRQRDYFLQQAPWNQLSVGGVGGIKTFTINNIINTGQLMVHLENFDSVSRGVAVTSILCGIDPAFPDYDTTPVAFQNKFIGLTYIEAGVAKLTGFIVITANSQDTILVNYVGCSSLHVRFSSADAVSTLVDVLYYLNYGLTASVSATGNIIGSTNYTIVEGVSSVNPVALRANANGVLTTLSSGLGVDSLSNTFIGGAVDSTFSNDALASAPFAFNGVTWDRVFNCTITKFVANVVATTTTLVPLASGQKIRICSIVIERNDVTGVATTLKLVEGTGANCGTGQTSLTGNLFTSGATAVTTDSPPISLFFGANGALIINTAGDGVCVQTTGAGSSFDVTVTEAQY